MNLTNFLLFSFMAANFCTVEWNLWNFCTAMFVDLGVLFVFTCLWRHTFCFPWPQRMVVRCDGGMGGVGEARRSPFWAFGSVEDFDGGVDLLVCRRRTCGAYACTPPTD
jgi:hypothetical protein